MDNPSFDQQAEPNEEVVRDWEERCFTCDAITDIDHIDDYGNCYDCADSMSNADKYDRLVMELLKEIKRMNKLEEGLCRY